MKVNVQIVSASNLNGVFPFVVVCFDNDLENEVFKTSATYGGPLAVWNESFEIDLASHVRKIVDSGKPEPAYLTFFMFDTGVENIPALGSAGVRLSTVRENGTAKGDFPVINGSGTLALVVDSMESEKWYQTNKGKIAAAGAAVGVGALAAGLTAMAVNKKKKNNRSNPDDTDDEDDDYDDEDGLKKKTKKKFSLTESVKALADRVTGRDNNNNDDDDDGDYDDDDDEDPEEYPQSQKVGGHHRSGKSNNGRSGAGSSSSTRGLPRNRGGRGAGFASAGGDRKWWDPETDEDDPEDDVDDEEDDVHDGRRQQAGNTGRRNARYGQPQPYDEELEDHLHYQEGYSGSAPAPATSGGGGRRNGGGGGGGVGHALDDGHEYQDHLQASDQPGEFGGTTYVTDGYHSNSDLAARLDA